MIVTHNLGTKNVIVQVYLKSSGKVVMTDLRIVDENSVEVEVNNTDENDLNVVVVAGAQWGAAEW